MISRKIDNLGRVTLPKEMRDALSLKEGEPVDITMQTGTITIEKDSFLCKICGSKLPDRDPELISHVCVGCANKIIDLWRAELW